MLHRRVAEYLIYLDKSVVQNKHDRSKIPRPCFAPEKHLTDIAHISDLWVTKTKLPVYLSEYRGNRGKANLLTKGRAKYRAQVLQQRQSE